MGESEHPNSPRTLTERRVAAALSIDRLELYLVAAEQHVGRYDPVTHLLTFSPAEVARIAARLGIPPPQFEEGLPEVPDRALKGVPEPSGE